MTLPLSIQALWQIVPLVGTIITVFILIGGSVIITWQLTKRHYMGFIEHQLNATAKNIVSRHEAKIKEVELLREKLQAEKMSRKEAMALITQLLEKLSI